MVVLPDRYDERSRAGAHIRERGRMWRMQSRLAFGAAVNKTGE
jgi:hypothetical protein